ncbi:MAG: glycosyl hydrolase family 65 protein [Pseudomonadota bacterium]|nr:glycosyl hydrolase family 65 protein [Pseudomonadota bacterium]
MSWILRYDSFEPEQEGLREVLTTLGNGYICVRGAGEETEAGNVHYPGTYLAGGYNRLITRIADRDIENEDLVNFPNFLPLIFRPKGGDWFSLGDVEILDYSQKLDIHKGMLTRTIRFKDDSERETTLRFRRIVSMAAHHYAGIQMTITAHNWSGRCDVRSSIDGSVVNHGVARYRKLSNRHLIMLEKDSQDDDIIWMTTETVQSHIRMTQAARTRVFSDEGSVDLQRHTTEEPGIISQTLTFYLKQDESVRVEKIVAIYTSRDSAITEPAIEARDAAVEAPSFRALLETHINALCKLWQRCDVEILPPVGAKPKGGASGELKHDLSYHNMVLRLHILHLLQTASPATADLDVGVPARGWHGEAYRGHIFWDELYILPFLNLRMPDISKGHLLYRYRRLGMARRLARHSGLKGALYPWQSSSNGREETQQLHLNPKSGNWLPDNTHLQRHVNAAIAHNVWQYFKSTDDYEFLTQYGAEMILEIARCFVSLTSWNEKRSRFEILGVMGPDEFHDAYPDHDEPGLNNNSYTNIMAVYVIQTALKAIDLLNARRRLELIERIGIDEDDLALWRDIASKMFVCFHEDGILTQFEGYEQLEEFDWKGYRAKYGNIGRLDRILEAEDKHANSYKCAKQADTLMLFYLMSADEMKALLEHLDYTFDKSVIPATIDYYAQRTSNGSTLANMVNAWVLAPYDGGRSWEIFEDALKSDIEDVQGGTTKEGIHLGVMAGTIDQIQRGYTGIEIHKGVLHFNPHLPKALPGIRMPLEYRRHALNIELDHKTLKISMIEGPKTPLQICVADQCHTLKQGKTYEFALVPLKAEKSKPKAA